MLVRQLINDPDETDALQSDDEDCSMQAKPSMANAKRQMKRLNRHEELALLKQVSLKMPFTASHGEKQQRWAEISKSLSDELGYPQGVISDRLCRDVAHRVFKAFVEKSKNLPSDSPVDHRDAVCNEIQRKMLMHRALDCQQDRRSFPDQNSVPSNDHLDSSAIKSECNDLSTAETSPIQEVKKPTKQKKRRLSNQSANARYTMQYTTNLHSDTQQTRSPTANDAPNTLPFLPKEHLFLPLPYHPIESLAFSLQEISASLNRVSKSLSCIQSKLDALENAQNTQFESLKSQIHQLDRDNGVNQP